MDRGQRPQQRLHNHLYRQKSVQNRDPKYQPISQDNFLLLYREEFPTFIDFVKEYYKSQELKGYCFDIIQNWADYYNIDNYGELVTTTTLISAVTTSSTTIDVESTRDFPSEGLLLIDDEIIYYQSKGPTLFETVQEDLTL